MAVSRTDAERSASEAMIRASLLGAPKPPNELRASDWENRPDGSQRWIGEERYQKQLRQAYGKPPREFGEALWFDDPSCGAAPTDSEGAE